MSNLPRVPLRYQPWAQDLLKSQEVLSGGMPGKGTDYELSESVPPVTGPVCRVPDDRELGNVVFRRFPNGMLDLDHARDVVVDLIHKAADKSPLTPLECTILGCLYPSLFPFVDSLLVDPTLRVTLRLSPWEVMTIQSAVAKHLAAEKNYNAGYGGGSDPAAPIPRA